MMMMMMMMMMIIIIIIIIIAVVVVIVIMFIMIIINIIIIIINENIKKISIFGGNCHFEKDKIAFLSGCIHEQKHSNGVSLIHSATGAMCFYESFDSKSEVCFV